MKLKNVLKWIDNDFLHDLNLFRMIYSMHTLMPNIVTFIEQFSKCPGYLYLLLTL